MISQLLAQARPAPGAAGDWQSMADRALADHLAAAHPFGLARLLAAARTV